MQVAAEQAGGRLHFCGTTELQVLCFNNNRLAVSVRSAKAVKVALALCQSLRPKGVAGRGPDPAPHLRCLNLMQMT